MFGPCGSAFPNGSPMTRIWYNHGYSQTRDALALLRRASDDLVLIASHASALAPAFLEADISAVEPSIDRADVAGAQAYTDWCLEFAAAHRVELFVVQRGRGPIARRSAEFQAIGTQLVIAADAATLEMIEDKARFYAATGAAGLPTPVVFEVDDVAGFDASVAALRARGHDACIKPPYGVFGNGYWRLRDDMSLFEQLMNPEARELRTSVVREAVAGMRGARLLVMQHLPGPEWSIDAVCRDGELLAGVARRKFAASQVIETSGPALDLAARVARLFGLSNLANIQLKAASDGTPYVLEVNPRMSGGCLYADLAGLNLPWLQILGATGRWPDEVPKRTAMTVSPINAAVDLGAPRVLADA